MLRLTTFGGLALSRDGVALTGAAAQRSRLSLLALLATAGPTGFSRDKLLLYLWPESDEERARHALKQAVYSLRRELGSEEVIVGTASLSLNPTIITSDAREFEAAIAANDLASAVAMYSGPFLDGFHLKDSTEFERWSAEQRAKFAHLWVSSVEKLAADCEARGGWRDAAGYWRTLAAAEPLSGRLALALMRALAESGDLGAALQQFKIHESLLREEIGSAPEAAVTSFAESLKNGTWVRSPEPPRTSLAAVQAAATNTPSLQHTAAIPVPPGARHSLGTARKRRRRSTAVAFVLGAVLMTAIGLTITYARMDDETKATLSLLRTRPGPMLEPRQIVVAPLENKTGDSTLNSFGDQVADWFARELSESDFKVVDARTARISTRVVEGIPRPLRARDENVALGEETGSAYTVAGAFYGHGDSVEANIRVIDVATKQTLKTLGPFRGSPATKPAPFITTMLAPTIAYLGAEVDTTAGGLTTRSGSTPPSLVAFQRVNAAWEHFFRTPRDTASVFAELDTASRLDSTYAVPFLMKGYMLDVKSEWSGVNTVVQRVKPLEPRMSKLERAVLELLEADLRGDALSRLTIARRLQSLSPGSPEMPLLRVVSALYVGNVAEAIAAIAEANPTRGMNLVTPTYLEWAAATYHASGNTTLEERAVRDELKRFRHHPPATYGRARILAAKNSGDLDELLKAGIPPAKDPNDPRDPAMEWFDLRVFAARELRVHGYPEEAKKILDEVHTALFNGGSLPARSKTPLMDARILYETGQASAASIGYQAILGADSTNLEAMGRIGALAARAGDAAMARQMDDRLKRTRAPYMMGANFRWRAVIAAAQGHSDEAVKLLETAVRQGHRLMDTPPNLTVHLDPDLYQLEKTPAYGAMLRNLTDASAAK